jgi:hypothetical protein
MRRRLLFVVPILVGMTLAGVHRHPLERDPPRGGHAAGHGAGSPGNPLLLSCGEEAFADTAVPRQPQPGDLAVGPLIIPNGKRLAAADPAGWGEHGDYKVPFIVTTDR